MTDEELLKVYNVKFVKVYDVKFEEMPYDEPEEQTAHVAALRAVYERGREDGARAQRNDYTVLAAHSGATTHREWHSSVGAWLYPGDSIVEQRAAPLASEAETDGSEKV